MKLKAYQAGQHASALTWLLLLGALAGVAFFWWKTAKYETTTDNGQPASAVNRPATNQNYQVRTVRPGVLEMTHGSNQPVTIRTLETNRPSRMEATNTNRSLPAGSTNRLSGKSFNASTQTLTNNSHSSARLPNTNAASPSLPVTQGSNVIAQRLPDKAGSTHATSINGYPRQPRDAFEAQVALEREGISSGPIDGVVGSQTRSALRAFQREWGLHETGELDPATMAALVLERPPCTNLLVSTNDLLRLQPISDTWLGKSRQTALDYESVLELVAEKSHAHPNLIKRLNPEVSWTNVIPGTTLVVPDPTPRPLRQRASWITIKLQEKVLQAFDAEENLLVHFPCSIAQRVEKRPVGDLQVVVAIPNPDYTFDPAVFPESAEGRRLKTKLLIRPGPNNPVGTAWIGLNKPGYGIHGTPVPEQVGRTESHGCFRLANWNAERLLKMLTLGTPVYVKP